jgi:uncharacterized membrane protein YfcA
MPLGPWSQPRAGARRFARTPGHAACSAAASIHIHILTLLLIAAAGVCIGLLAGMLGAGTSILTVLLLTRAAGLDLERAMTTSLVVVSFTSFVALTSYAKERAVAWKPAVSFGAASTGAAFVAGRMASLVPERPLQGLFLVCTVAAALAMFVRRRSSPRVELAAPPRTTVLAGSGLLAGTMTGLVGLGGGYALVPLLVVYARTPVRSAIAAALLIKVIDTLAGLGGRLPHPHVDWHVAAYLGTTQAVGSLLGARLSMRMSRTSLRRAFAVIMVVAAVLTVLGRTPSH